MVAYMLPGYVDTTSSPALPSAAPPGAATPHCAFPRWLEYGASCPVGVVAATTIMCRLPKLGVWALLPAATTGTAPCDQAYSTPAENPGPKATRDVASAPRLRLTTDAPWSTTQRMPAPTSPSLPEPSVFTTRATTRRASGAIDATPMPLLVIAAMIPATCVPCPLESVVPPGWQRAGSPLDPTQSAPSVTLPARSSWPASIPESTTPTAMPAPVDAVQAAGAPACRRPHCTGGWSQT